MHQEKMWCVYIDVREIGGQKKRRPIGAHNITTLSCIVTVSLQSCALLITGEHGGI